MNNTQQFPYYSNQLAWIYNMRKYLPHILIISFVFLLAPSAQVASYAGAIEDTKEEVRKNPDDAKAHVNLGYAYGELGKYKEAIDFVCDIGFVRAVLLERR